MVTEALLRKACERVPELTGAKIVFDRGLSGWSALTPRGAVIVFAPDCKHRTIKAVEMALRETIATSPSAFPLPIYV